MYYILHIRLNRAADRVEDVHDYVQQLVNKFSLKISELTISGYLNSKQQFQVLLAATFNADTLDAAVNRTVDLTNDISLEKWTISRARHSDERILECYVSPLDRRQALRWAQVRLGFAEKSSTVSV